MQVFVNRRALRGEAEEWLSNVALAWESDDCLLWPFGKYGIGYGAYRKGSAHHEVCRRAHGEAPVGYEAAHSCGVRVCVNKGHLRWATRAENQADRIQHGTAWRGEKHKQSKLTREQVEAIRLDPRTSLLVAVEYGVSARHVRKLRAGSAWSWL